MVLFILKDSNEKKRVGGGGKRLFMEDGEVCTAEQFLLMLIPQIFD